MNIEEIKEKQEQIKKEIVELKNKLEELKIIEKNIKKDKKKNKVKVYESLKNLTPEEKKARIKLQQQKLYEKNKLKRLEYSKDYYKKTHVSLKSKGQAPYHPYPREVEGTGSFNETI